MKGGRIRVVGGLKYGPVMVYEEGVVAVVVVVVVTSLRFGIVVVVL